MVDKKRITKNTLALYMRMLLSIVISLYTSRVVLEVLGIEDFGVYAIVGGITAMLSFINASMGGASSRFLAYEIGSNHEDNLPLVFTSALYIHGVISVIFLFFAETLGLWIVANKIVIPIQSYNAALWVYQLTVFTSIIGILRTPYSALLIAHEKITIYAYIEIFDVALKLCVVLLLKVIPGDKLICYAVLLFLMSLCTGLILLIYVMRHYNESHIVRIKDRRYFKPMLSFSGWNLLGDVGYTLRQNGSNIVLNLFFGPIVNAANGIAMTVQGTVMSLSTNAITAVRPPIIKSYSSGNLIEAGRMIASGSIFALSAMLIISGPLMINIDFVLSLWLSSVPEFCAQFAVICLLSGAVSCFSNVIYIGSQAAGRIKAINMVRFVIYTLSLIVLYILLRLNFPPITAYYTILVVLILTSFVNLALIKPIFGGFPIKNTIFRFIYVFALFFVILIPLNIVTSKMPELTKFFISSVFFCLLYIAGIYYLILSKNERFFVTNLVVRFFKKNG